MMKMRNEECEMRNYSPLTGDEILALRRALPGIVAWLREREGK